MAVQLSNSVRSAKADAVESAIGTAPTLEIRTGAQPSDCSQADSGTLLASMTLPSDWMNAASNGVKTMAGTWQDPSANAAGTAAHFRIKQGATCHMQGSVGGPSSGADIELDNASIEAGQEVNITQFTLTEANS